MNKNNTKLIIVCGYSGTGKTTLSNELSKRLKIFCLHKDSIKESLYDSMDLSSLEDSKRLGYPSIKTILDLAKENLKNNVDVILESPFVYKEDGNIFEEWKKELDIEIFTIILNIDEEERKKRFLERERHRSHHDDKRNVNDSNANHNFEYMPNKKIFITTNKPMNELVEKIIDEIK